HQHHERLAVAGGGDELLQLGHGRAHYFCARERREIAVAAEVEQLAEPLAAHPLLPIVLGHDEHQQRHAPRQRALEAGREQRHATQRVAGLLGEGLAQEDRPEGHRRAHRHGTDELATLHGSPSSGLSGAALSAIRAEKRWPAVSWSSPRTASSVSTVTVRP